MREATAPSWACRPAPTSISGNAKICSASSYTGLVKRQRLQAHPELFEPILMSCGYLAGVGPSMNGLDNFLVVLAFGVHRGSRQVNRLSTEHNQFCRAANMAGTKHLKCIRMNLVYFWFCRRFCLCVGLVLIS